MMHASHYMSNWTSVLSPNEMPIRSGHCARDRAKSRGRSLASGAKAPFSRRLTAGLKPRPSKTRAAATHERNSLLKNKLTESRMAASAPGGWIFAGIGPKNRSLSASRARQTAAGKKKRGTPFGMTAETLRGRDGAGDGWRTEVRRYEGNVNCQPNGIRPAERGTAATNSTARSESEPASTAARFDKTEPAATGAKATSNATATSTPEVFRFSNFVFPFSAFNSSEVKNEKLQH
jgi:hypothetical protein